jgi:hypothetical protein
MNTDTNEQLYRTSSLCDKGPHSQVQAANFTLATNPICIMFSVHNILDYFPEHPYAKQSQ